MPEQNKKTTTLTKEEKINLFQNPTKEFLDSLVQRSDAHYEKEAQKIEREGEVEDYNYFPNKDALKTAMDRYCRDYAISGVLISEVQSIKESNTDFERDTSPIAILLSDGTREDIAKQACRFFHATRERSKGNFGPIREICKEVLDKNTGKTAFDYDLSNPDEIYKYKTFSAAFGSAVQILEKDKEFYNELCKDPKQEVKFSVTSQALYMIRNFEQNEITATVDKITPVVVQFATTVHDPKEREFDMGTNENEYMKYNVAKVWSDITIKGLKNPKFEIPPTSIGVKTHGSKFTYEPSYFKSFDALNKISTSIPSDLTEKNSTGLQNSISVAEEFITTQNTFVMGTMYQKKFSKDFPTFGNKFVKDYIFIGEESLRDLTDKQLEILREKNPETELDENDVAKVIVAQALGDPNKVISTAILAPADDGSFKFNVVPFEKDYTKAIETSTKNHGYFRSFLHMFGWKYPEESLQEKQQAAINTFKENNSIKNIEDKIQEKVGDKLETLSKSYEKDKSVSLDNKKEIQAEVEHVSRKSISVKEANHTSKDIAKNEIKNQSKEKEIGINK